jgi:hypothetical protein
MPTARPTVDTRFRDEDYAGERGGYVMLQVFPVLSWLAAVTSGALLLFLWDLGELRRYSGAALLGWFLIAGYCQFLGWSPIVRTVGLCLQTILAIVLSLRWKLSS